MTVARPRGVLTLAGPLVVAMTGVAAAQDPAVDEPVVAVAAAAHRVASVGIPIHPRVAPSPDGSRFAVVQVRPRPVLWIVPAGGDEPLQFRELWAAYHPRWSADGGRIGFIAAIGPPRIWTIDVDSISGRPLAPPRLLIRTAANAFALSPDGDRIALVAARSSAAGASEVHIVDWESRRYRVVLRADGIIYRLDWAPDGVFLFYGLLRENAEGENLIVKAPVAGGARTTLREAGEFLGLSPDGARLLYRPHVDPQDDPQAARHLIEVAPPDGGAAIRIRLPADAGPPQWSSTSESLLVVRSGSQGDSIWEIPLPPPR